MVGLTVFTIFVAISTVYYTTLFPEVEGPMEDAKSFISEQVFDSLSVSAQDVYVKYDGGPALLRFDFNWPHGTPNSTIVLDSNGASLDCIIEGNTLSWAVPGTGTYTVRYSDAEVELRCDRNPSGPIVNVVPWAGVPQKLFSEERISEMNATPYDDFREALGIDQNFRVWINMSGTEYWYGPVPSPTSAIYTSEKRGTLETGEPVSVRILMW